MVDYVQFLPEQLNIVQQAVEDSAFRDSIAQLGWVTYISERGKPTRKRSSWATYLLGTLKRWSAWHQWIGSTPNEQEVAEVLKVIVEHLDSLLKVRETDPSERKLGPDIDAITKLVHGVDTWLTGQKIGIDKDRLVVLGKQLERILQRARDLCQDLEHVVLIAARYRGSYQCGADFDSIFFDDSIDFYPPIKYLQFVGTPYPRPILSFPTSKSTLLLLSFPGEILRQIFHHGASSLTPKPGMPCEDELTYNTYRSIYLLSASLVTTSWRIEAQLELLSYARCDSVHTLDRLVTMLEATGRVRGLKRLVLIQSSFKFVDTEWIYIPPCCQSFTLEDHPIHRLLELDPELDELEISGHSTVLAESVIDYVKKIPTAILKLSDVSALYRPTSLTTRTLVLKSMVIDFDRGEEEFADTSRLESLVIIASDITDELYYLSDEKRLNLHEQNQFMPHILTSENLKTLSMDGSPLSQFLLSMGRLPAFTTFELIPYDLTDETNMRDLDDLLCQVLEKIPTLEKIILPGDFFRESARRGLDYLRDEIGQIQVEFTACNSWNSLKY